MFSEQAFYYHFYAKTVSTLQAHESFVVGIPFVMQGLVMNNMTEFPDTINAIQRFNIYPEVFLAIGHRLFQRAWEWAGGNFRDDWMHCILLSNDEPGGPPLRTCIGFGEPVFFYLFFVFALQGLLAAAMFLLGWYALVRRCALALAAADGHITAGN